MPLPAGLTTDRLGAVRTFVRLQMWEILGEQPNVWVSDPQYAGLTYRTYGEEWAVRAEPYFAKLEVLAARFGVGSDNPPAEIRLPVGEPWGVRAWMCWRAQCRVRLATLHVQRSFSDTLAFDLGSRGAEPAELQAPITSDVQIHLAAEALRTVTLQGPSWLLADDPPT